MQQQQRGDGVGSIDAPRHLSALFTPDLGQPSVAPAARSRFKAIAPALSLADVPRLHHQEDGSQQLSSGPSSPSSPRLSPAGDERHFYASLGASERSTLSSALTSPLLAASASLPAHLRLSLRPDASDRERMRFAIQNRLRDKIERRRLQGVSDEHDHAAAPLRTLYGYEYGSHPLDDEANSSLLSSYLASPSDHPTGALPSSTACHSYPPPLLSSWRGTDGRQGERAPEDCLAASPVIKGMLGGAPSGGMGGVRSLSLLQERGAAPLVAFARRPRGRPQGRGKRLTARCNAHGEVAGDGWYFERRFPRRSLSNLLLSGHLDGAGSAQLPPHEDHSLRLSTARQAPVASLDSSEALALLDDFMMLSLPAKVAPKQPSNGSSRRSSAGLAPHQVDGAIAEHFALWLGRDCIEEARYERAGASPRALPIAAAACSGDTDQQPYADGCCPMLTAEDFDQFFVLPTALTGSAGGPLCDDGVHEGRSSIRGVLPSPSRGDDADDPMAGGFPSSSSCREEDDGLGHVASPFDECEYGSRMAGLFPAF